MSDVPIPTADGRLRGYLAIPDGEGPWPGVVVVHDIPGMTAELKRITDRFAAGGYLAMAPSLYDGSGPKIKGVVGAVRAHFTGRGLSYDNLLAAREYLMSDNRCAGRVGLAGFYMGAGFCLQLAPGGLFDATVPHDVKKYPRAGHSFMNEHPLPAPIRLVAGLAGVAYSAPEAEDAWQRILTFFADHLAVTGKDLDALDRI